MNELCFYCGLKMFSRRAPGAVVLAQMDIGKGQDKRKKMIRYAKKTREHLVRKADGGRDDGNIVYAHAYCNSSRGAKTVEQHKEQILYELINGSHPLSILKGIK